MAGQHSEVELWAREIAEAARRREQANNNTSDGSRELERGSSPDDIVRIAKAARRREDANKNSTRLMGLER